MMREFLQSCDFWRKCSAAETQAWRAVVHHRKALRDALGSSNLLKRNWALACSRSAANWEDANHILSQQRRSSERCFELDCTHGTAQHAYLPLAHALSAATVTMEYARRRMEEAAAACGGAGAPALRLPPTWPPRKPPAWSTCG